jgi:ribonuclease HIII
MRIAAATSLIKLVHLRRYEHLLTHDHFEALAWVLIDPSSQVRKAFSEKLKVMIPVRVPVKYLALVAIGEVEEKVVGILAAAIKSRRMFIKSSEELSASQTAELLPEYPETKAKGVN